MAQGNPAKRILSCAVRFCRTVCAWTVKFVKTKFQECKRCRAQKTMDERVKRLGTEVYSLYKQDETEFYKSAPVQQQLKLVEEAEARLFEIYDRIETIDNEYRRKLQDISEAGEAGEKTE